jgi:hypothetical protein
MKIVYFKYEKIIFIKYLFFFIYKIILTKNFFFLCYKFLYIFIKIESIDWIRMINKIFIFIISFFNFLIL